MTIHSASSTPIVEKENCPLVSVITATRNLIKAGREAFFRKAVQSVREQDYKNIEHLIIDGASDDGTVDLLKELELDYISEPDKGIHDASNKGIKKAKGKYIFFLNSDDYFIGTDSVSKCVNVLEKNNADFTYAEVPLVDNNEKTISMQHIKLRYMFLTMPFGFSGVMLNRISVIEAGMFDEKIKISGDFDLIWRMYKIGKKSIMIDFPICSWRTGGISYTNPGKRTEEYAYVLSKNTGQDENTARIIIERKYIPLKLLRKILSECPYVPAKAEIWKKNILNSITWHIKKFLHLNR